MRAVKNLLVLYTGGTIGMLETPEGLAPAGGFEARMREHFAKMAKGTKFGGENKVGLTIEALMKLEAK